MQGHGKLFLDRRLFRSVRGTSFSRLASTQDNHPSPDVYEECQILKEVAHADTHDGTDHCYGRFVICKPTINLFQLNWVFFVDSQYGLFEKLAQPIHEECDQR